MAFTDGATLVITGGTGTFGQAMTQYVCETIPPAVIQTVRILSRDEYKQAQMAEHFAAHRDRLRFFLGDVRDRTRVQLALRGAQYVIHAAALKRIEQGEYNPLEFMQTNVLGTRNVILACLDHNIQRAIFLGTDKGCAPENVYGATKCLAERLWIQANSYSPHTQFVGVRYGNVMGSRGSVLEVFRQCIREGRKLPVTDLTMTRFFLAMQDATRLVHRAFDAMVPAGSVLIPALQAFNVKTLCQALLPREWTLPLNESILPMAVRPGERAYELLALEMEQRRWYMARAAQCLNEGTICPLELYLVPPAAPQWPYVVPAHDWMPYGCMTEPYRSDTWPRRLGVDQMREALLTV